MSQHEPKTNTISMELEGAMQRAFHEVSELARTTKADRRLAAYALALRRINAVYAEREIFP